MPRVLRILNRLNLGGPTFNAAYLSKYLAPEFETLLVAGMKDKTEASSEFIVKNLGLEPVRIPEMHRELNPLKDYQAYQKLKKIIEDFKPDIVHTHAAKSGALGRLAAYHAGVPVILHTFHGHVFHSYFSPLKTKFYLEVEKYLAKKSTCIIAISNKQKKELTEDFNIAPPEKFEVIPLGFDLSRFQQNQKEKREKFRKEWNLDEDEIAIGIVGRLVPIKDHELFLINLTEIFNQLNKKVEQAKLRAFIIGDGELRQELENRAAALNIQFTTKKGEKAPLTFTSWIKEVDEVMAGMDIIALTSKNEGTPVSLIEAQAANKPIVTTDVGGVRDVVKEGETAFLSPSGDAGAFAENLMQLIENEILRTKMGKKGFEIVSAQYSYQRLVNDMRALYHRLLLQAGRKQ